MRSIPFYLALAVCGCGSTTLQSPPRQPKPPALMPLPATTDPLVSVRFSIRYSEATNLFHWVDNLAESSPSKNRFQYYRDWVETFGPLSRSEREQLSEFRSIRTRRFPLNHSLQFDGANACLPIEDNSISRRQQLSIAAMNATSVDDLVARLGALVEPAEAVVLERTIRTFATRFETLWSRAQYLPRIQSEFESFLKQPRTQQLLSYYVRFYGLSGEFAEMPTINLVAVFDQEGSTHAEANAHQLLMEVRPEDHPAQQAQVIFHEFCHDLFRRLTPDRQRELRSRFYRQGRDGVSAWTLTYEALPTALGQGLAQAILTPEEYKWPVRWYHIDEIDLAAKAIYPVVRNEFFSGRTLFGPLPELIVERVGRTKLASRISPLDQVAEGMIVTPEPVPLALRNTRFPLPVRPIFQVDPDTAAGSAFIARAECLPLVGFVTETDLATLAVTKDEGVAVPHAFSPLPKNAAGIVVPSRRPSGAAALWVIAVDDSQVQQMVDAVVQMRGWPSQPVVIRR